MKPDFIDQPLIEVVPIYKTMMVMMVVMVVALEGELLLSWQSYSGEEEGW